MNCPICGIVAKRSQGLHRHLVGTRPYGGHELTGGEAAFAVAAVVAADQQSASSSDAYLEQALANLVANKKLPKYQFERAVDAFLGVFLPAIVEQLTPATGPVRLVAQEFPLKKPDSNQSTNVDYVLFDAGNDVMPWIFLELKTDSGSMKDSQALIYAQRLPTATMSQLLDDVRGIMGVSKVPAKYAALLERFTGFEDHDGHARAVYLTPGEASLADLLPEGTDPRITASFGQILSCVTFSSLGHVHLDSYPEAWALFIGRVVPEVMARASEPTQSSSD